MKNTRIVILLAIFALFTALVGAQDEVETANFSSVLVHTAGSGELVNNDDDTFTLRLSESAPVAGYIFLQGLDTRSLSLAGVTADLATAASLYTDFGVAATLQADAYDFDIVIRSANFDAETAVYSYILTINEVTENGEALKSVDAAPESYEAVTLFINLTEDNITTLIEAQQERLSNVRFGTGAPQGADEGGQIGTQCGWGTCNP